MKRFIDAFRHLKPALALLTLLLWPQVSLAQSAVARQAVGLPLSSVGREVGWFKRNGGDVYRLAVFERAANTPLSVDLYSPEINLNDYANKRNVQNYYGDEIYGQGIEMKTTFALLDKDGSKLAEQSFGNGTEHSFDLLYTGSLPQGYYPLQVNTFGNGKNAFGFRVPAGMAIEASQFTVVTRGKFNQDQLAGRLTIGRSALGKTFTIENFDADGPEEMEIFVQFPNGKRVRLTSSPDTQWASNSIQVTEDNVGEWAVLVRIKPTTRQFSNSVTFRLALDGKPYFARMPSFEGEAPKGTLNVNAKARFCEQEVVVQGNTFTAINRTFKTPATILLAPTSYEIVPGVLPGASASPVTVQIKNRETSTATLVYEVKLGLRTLPDKAQLKEGETTIIKVEVSSLFPYAIPFKLAVEPSSNIEVQQLPFSEGTVKADAPITIPVVVKAKQAGAGSLKVSLEPSCVVAQAALEVLAPPPPPPKKPEVDLGLSKTVSPTKVETGSSVSYTLTVVNNGPDDATKVVLTDRLPVGLNLTGSSPNATVDGRTLTWNLGNLAKGESKSVTVQATAGVAGRLVNQASVKAAEDETKLDNNQSSATLEVVAPPPPPPPAKEPEADLALSKSVTPGKVNVGEQVTYTISVSNRGPDAASQVVLTDPLPSGLTVVSTTPAATVSGNTLTWNLGNLAKDERKTVSVVATASTEGRLTNTASVSAKEKDGNPDNNRATATVEAAVPPPPPPGELPPIERESQVLLLAKLKDNPDPGLVILSDKIPAGATYIPGSSRRIPNPSADLKQLQDTTQWLPGPQAGGEAIADPLQRGDRLYWILPYNPDDTFAITYRLAHSGALKMPEDRVGMVLGIPQARSADLPRSPNVAAESPIGAALGLGELRLLQGSPEVLEGLLKALPIGVQNNPAQIEVGGPATRIVISRVRLPNSLTNDATSQPALLIQAFDKEGKAASDEYADLEVTPEPATPDASPELPGYQVKLEKGQGVVRLSDLAGSVGAQTAPVEVVAEARVTNANGTISSSLRFNVKDVSVNDLEGLRFSIRNQPRPWLIVGAVGLQLNLPSFSVVASAQAFARGDLGNETTLTLALNGGYDSSLGNFTATDLLPPADPYERFPILGDSSRIGSDARSSDCCYFKLERGNDYLMYGQINPGFSGLVTGYSPNLNGLQALVREPNFSLSGFVSQAINANRAEFFRGSGGFYRLSGTSSTLASPTVSGLASASVEPNSEQIRVLVYDKTDPNLKLAEYTLERFKDYSIDYLTGNILLARPLFSTDANNNPQYLKVDYALAGAVPQIGQLRYGVQGGLELGGFSLKATLLKFDPSREALYGLGAGFQAGPLSLFGEVAYSGAGGQGVAAGGFQIAYSAERFQLLGRYQDVGDAFVDSNSGTTSSAPGKDAQVAATLKLSPSFSLTGRYSLNQNYAQGGDLDQAYSLQARNDFGALAASLGLAGTVGDDTGEPNKLWLTAGLEAELGKFTVGALQKIGFGNTNGATNLFLDYAISNNFGLRYTQELIYVDALNRIDGRGSLGARGTFANAEIIQTLTGNTPETPEAFGSTNIAAVYDLPGADGQAGRARVGVDTSVPLSKELSAQLAGEVVMAPAGQGSGTLAAGLRYEGEGIKASARSEFSLTALGLQQIYKLGGIFQVTPDFIFSPSAEFGALTDGTSGLKFSLAAAYRGDDWSLLTNNKYRTGSLYAPSGNDLEGEIRLAYEAGERFFLRGGVAYKLVTDVFTGQVSAGFTYFLTDIIGVGANAAYLFQPYNPAPSSKLSFGIEGSLRVAPGLLLGAGFNFVGFEGLGTFNTEPGFYIRLDWKFDERLFGLP